MGKTSIMDIWVKTGSNNLPQNLQSFTYAGNQGNLEIIKSVLGSYATEEGRCWIVGVDTIWTEGYSQLLYQIGTT